MRNNLFALIACALALRLAAAEQFLTVTPQSLDGWSVTGADRAVLAQAPALSLPAGSILGREFANNAVVLHLVSRPVLSETPADWPILAVGPAALALIGNNEKGRLVLVVGESTLIELPWTAVIDQANPALDLILAYDPETGAGIVGLGDQVKSFDAGLTAKPVEVVLSAGNKHDWAQDSMDILVLTSDPIESGVAVGAAGRESAKRGSGERD